MKFSIVALALSVSSVMALPSEAASGHSLLARDRVKLNQYRTLDDCKNDRNILFHAAPPANNCYDLDKQTGAFFYNTGGYLLSQGKFYPQV
ncbi:hypothetical protein PFICI_14207 [Pestalotiopsis fici W106-1]|uniref:Uncharacterized protein n=1 Tax=Pestalotiopsis fici (strain W106-1 / CGMCC3.15140) TaxID=1229662 RepID=W3WNF2_PESFW|nr:uncharacterized protein PFICI_14207 [Pestalotiopsis fici W106-1]ETS74341.1 hypothetical protein PFICI_14207 [Pestalotiopsis fici W106-1]